MGVRWAIVAFVRSPARPSFLFPLGSVQSSASAVFPYTWASSLGLFVLATWLFWTRYRLDLIRSVLFALGLAFAATSLFEILYQDVGVGSRVGDQGLEGQDLNVSSLARASCGLRFWRAGPAFLGALALYLVGWLASLSAGYPQIYEGSGPRTSFGYAFNAGLQVGSYVVLAPLDFWAGEGSRTGREGSAAAARAPGPARWTLPIGGGPGTDRVRSPPLTRGVGGSPAATSTGGAAPPCP